MNPQPTPDSAIKFTVQPLVDFETKTFGCETTDIAGKISRKIACSEDEAIKRALIALGWTPPDKSGERQAAIQKAYAVLGDVLKSFDDESPGGFWIEREPAAIARAELAPFVPQA